jgi:predicted lactoylglutathione lyase
MKWIILNVSIPVHNLKKSQKFYEMILGETYNKEDLYQTLFKSDQSVFFGNKGFGLRLYKPKFDLLLKDTIQSRRTYISIIVDNIDQILENLNKENISFIFKNIDKSNQFKSLLVQEPSMNLVQFIENKNAFNNELDTWNMDLSWSVHHMNIESLDVRSSMNFFCKLIGMTEGKWIAPTNKGDFSIDPSELAILPLSNDNRGLHVIKPDDGFGWRNNFAHNPSIGGHPAFTIKDLSGLKEKLDKKKILYSDAKVYAMPGYHQIYLYDINANMLEINQAV